MKEENIVCIAIYKPEDITINNHVFENSFAWNEDGAGFLVWDSKRNKLICKTGFFTLEDFLHAFKPYQKKRAVIHFRKVTHGPVNEANCHPFMVNDDLGFVHNGVIRNVKIWDKNFSDTWHFNEAIMKPFIKDYGDIWQHKTFRYLIQKYINKSRLIFMSNTGDYKIYNEAYGIWDSGCWFSNDYYQYDIKDLSANWEKDWPNYRQLQALEEFETEKLLAIAE